MGTLVPTPTGILPLSGAGNASVNSSKTGTPVWINPPSTNGANQDYKSFTSLYISRKFGKPNFLHYSSTTILVDTKWIQSEIRLPDMYMGEDLYRPELPMNLIIRDSITAILMV